MTRALVVDDSQFMRTVVGNELRDHGFEVVEASNGRQAIEKVDEHDPDVITMDVAMPEMDGIEAVEHIMGWRPTPILMVSAYTEEGAEATLDALQKGAVDFIQKPDGEVSIDTQSIEDELVEKVEAAVGADVEALTPVEGATSATEAAAEAVDAAASAADAAESAGPKPTGDGETASVPASPPTGFDPGTVEEAHAPTVEEVSSVIEEQLDGEYVDEPTVVVGASTGGPKVVNAILHGLPRALDARVLVVQHMPASFTGRFAARLDRISAYEVAEAEDGDRVGGGQARVARGDTNLAVTNSSSGRLRLAVDDDGPDHGVRPSIDVTMETAAAAVEGPLVAVALSGMGSDGAEGIRAVKEAGGTTIVQDESTSPVFGIPKQAIATGCVDHVLPADELVAGILEALTEEGD